MYPHFECKNCIERGKQAERGCDSDAPFSYWNDIDGEPRLRCPRRPIYEDPHWYNSVIEAYNFYKNGFLPHIGGMMDQAALFPFIVSVVDNIINKCDEIEMEKARQARENGGGKSVLTSKTT